MNATVTTTAKTPKIHLLPPSLWLAGFRPLFFLAFLSGVLLPLVWGLVFSGHLSLPSSALPILQWHAHEMLFGFGWAVLGGFLLTASKNWVKIRGIHGAPLILVTAMWIAERIAVLFAGELHPWLRILSLNAFLLACAGYVLYCLIRYHSQDSFKDNYFFIAGLPLFLVAKNLLLDPQTFALGAALSIGLFRLAFAVMLERTTPQFMKNAMNIELPRWAALDFLIKGTVFLSAFSAFLPPAAGAAVLGLAGTAMMARFLQWHPLAGLRQFGIAIMYVGHFGLILHLFFEAAKISALWSGAGSLSAHVFTFLCMGVIIPGMLIRISQGHTGRKLAFTKSDRLGFFCMATGALARLILTQIWPEHYTLWIGVSAAGWSLCFAIVGFRVAPFLFQPRVDGKVH